MRSRYPHVILVRHQDNEPDGSETAGETDLGQFTQSGDIPGTIHTIRRQTRDISHHQDTDTGQFTPSGDRPGTVHTIRRQTRDSSHHQETDPGQFASSGDRPGTETDPGSSHYQETDTRQFTPSGDRPGTVHTIRRQTRDSSRHQEIDPGQFTPSGDRPGTVRVIRRQTRDSSHHQETDPGQFAPSGDRPGTVRTIRRQTRDSSHHQETDPGQFTPSGDRPGTVHTIRRQTRDSSHHQETDPGQFTPSGDRPGTVHTIRTQTRDNSHHQETNPGQLIPPYLFISYFNYNQHNVIADSVICSTRIWNITGIDSVTAATYTVVNNNDQAQLVAEYFSPVLSIILGSSGLVFNVINTAVFVRQGVKDCVTLCLLSLSLTDNGSLCFGLMAAGCRIFKAVTSLGATKIFVDPMSVWLLLVQGQFCFYDLSTYTTAFIALERCLCVVWPLKFKMTFTLKTSVFVLMTLYAGTFLLHVFFFAYTEFRTVYNPKLNISQSFIYQGSQRLLLEKYLQVLNHLCLSCVALLVIVTATCLTIQGLVKSNRFRNKRASNRTAKCPTGISELSQTDYDNSTSAATSPVTSLDFTTGESSTATTTARAKLSERNARVVKMVYILALICFLCDSLRFAIMTLFYVDGEMRPSGVRAVAFTVLSGLVFLIQIVNCSVNTIVYLTCNRNYKQTFYSLFRCSRKAMED
ncbi:hypothetical protein Btru_014484 [Bulinus truncatus]|nr:hypothetical protein Btru_014484 [Bulinus truncatus]